MAFALCVELSLCSSCMSLQLMGTKSQFPLEINWLEWIHYIKSNKEKHETRWQLCRELNIHKNFKLTLICGSAGWSWRACSHAGWVLLPRRSPLLCKPCPDCAAGNVSDCCSPLQLGYCGPGTDSASQSPYPGGEVSYTSLLLTTGCMASTQIHLEFHHLNKDWLTCQTILQHCEVFMCVSCDYCLHHALMAALPWV